ncbi:MAG: DUF1800 domain-containing protein [Planctomycetota bacterium]|nr:DUF1800 domain-containing protein [Planctomycetota bacterium]
MRRFIYTGLASLLLLAATTNGRAQEDTGRKTSAGQQTGLSEDQRVHHFLNRFTLGATPALMAEVKTKGMRKWLEEQLKGDRPEPESLKQALGKLSSLEMTLGEIADEYVLELEPDATPQQRRQARQLAQLPAKELLDSVMLRGALSNNQLREVGSDFFRNHFAVSLEKGPVELMAVNWERTVIREGALGNFGEMLDRSAHHPAMLFFLDNHLSCRPATEAEIEAIERRGRNVEKRLEALRQRGLNENYARELLELHTLGVDNYYTQDDVIEVAKCLTGWTITPRRAAKLVDRDPMSFLFVRDFHCTGDKTVLGTTIKENRDNPEAEGAHVIKLLAAHEGTARFLSWKLCRWFVNDEPDEKMVERVAKVFRDSKGDLPSVYLAIFDDPCFFEQANYLAKYKRPFEFVVSALRATGAEIGNPTILHRQLVEMNESIYRCADPTGYYDQAEAWQDPGAMSLRWKFAYDLARGSFLTVRLPRSFYDDLPESEPGKWKDILARKLLCMPLSAQTSAALDKLIERKQADTKPRQLRGELGPLLVAGILGSPEFQKQ